MYILCCGSKVSRSTHDAFTWRMSGVNQRISSGDIPIVNGWFLGDSGYPLRPNLLTPILSPETPKERRYNRAFLKTRTTRKTIECAFSLLESRWRSLNKTGGSLLLDSKLNLLLEV